MPFSNGPLLYTLSSFALCQGRALPRSLTPRQDFGVPQQQPPGSPANPNASLKPTIWVPVLAISGFLVLMVILRIFWRQRQYRRLQAQQRAAASARGEPIALTATQLAGSGTAGTETQRRARRPRRPRRTPSQISTKSLPAYMEAPGEQEIVLVRRQESLAEEEEEEEESGHRRNISEATMQSDDENDEPSERPLLNGSHSRQPSSQSPTSRLSIIRQSEDSERALLNDDRGEAPAYIEVVQTDDASGMGNSSQSTLAHDTTANSSQVPLVPSPKRSGFRRFLPSWSTTPARPAPAPVSTPAINASSPTPNPAPAVTSPTSPTRLPQHRSSLSLAATVSATPSDASSSTPPSQRNSGIHRASSSIGSLFGLRSPPPAPRPAPNHPAISSPVPTSVTRTQFQYPTTGLLTPEQMAFVSSTQSLIRFGVPYGEAASLVPPSYTESPNRRRGSSLDVSADNASSRRSSDAADAASGRTRTDSDSSALAPSVTQPTGPNASQISIPRFLDPVQELPTPISPRDPSPPPSKSAAAETAAPKPTIDAEPPHRRESSSTTNTFATAPQALAEEDDDDSSMTHTDPSSEHSTMSRLSMTTAGSAADAAMIRDYQSAKDVPIEQPPVSTTVQ